MTSDQTNATGTPVADKADTAAAPRCGGRDGGRVVLRLVAGTTVRYSSIVNRR